jgi:two-component sensor histidine kinase
MTVKVPALFRRSAVERTILALLSLAFLLLVTVVVASGFMVQGARNLDDQVNHSQRVRANARDVLINTLDAETGERGYLATDQPVYLMGYNDAVDRLTATMKALTRQVRGDLGQMRRVDTLRLHVDARVVELKRSVAYVVAGRAPEAVVVMRQGKGLEEMTRIRVLIAEIDRVETNALAKHSQAAGEAEERTLLVNVASALLIAAVGLISIAVVRQYVGQLRESRVEIDRVNQGLEETVEARTGDLVQVNDDLRLARDRAETLLREVNHRIGNSLQLASSFIAMQSRAIKGAGAKAALRDTQSRLEAVAHIHRSLYTSEDVTVVELKDYLTGLVEALRGSLAPFPGGPKIVFRADPLTAPTDRAVSLGVILAELVTNAVKYAYAPGAAGEIRIRLKAKGELRGVLVVEDDGAGMSGGAPKGTGLGARIIEAMAANLNGEVTYDAKEKGVRATLAFKL